MNVRRISLHCALLVAGAIARRGEAQQADVIRGQITEEGGAPIAEAVIQARSIPANIARSTKTDASGRYTLTYANGEGDYWITVTALGFTPKRFEVKRIADEQVLLGNARLARAGVLLETVDVRAARARPGRAAEPDVSGTEKVVGSGSTDPTQAGNLAAMAAGSPGVQLVPGADGNPDQFSVFGLSGDQNNATLNGLSFGGADVPRDASMRAMLGTSPWDVSRGGFSGGQIGLSTQSGSNFSARSLSSLLNGPALQWTDRAGRALGAEYASASIGAATSGPIAIDRSFYGLGYQYDRRQSEMSNLEVGDPFALRLAGVAPDSLARLQSVLGDLGVPGSVSRIPEMRTSDRGLFLGSIDLAPPASTSGQALNLTAAGSFTRLSSPFAQVTAFPTNDARTMSWFGSLQARHTTYFGVGILSETSAGVTASRFSTTPYLALPNGGVRVASVLDDGSTGINGLTFGGSQTQRTSNENRSLGAQNQLSWFSQDSKHRIKLTTSLRSESFTQDVSANQLGTFRYNSLADLEAGRPAVFTRLLSPRVRAGQQLLGALSLGDSWRPRTDLQLQYGVRLDGNRFLDTPEANAELRNIFGVDNGDVPNRVYVSPRLGFSWTYGQAKQLAIGSGYVRAPRAVVRGGIGVFQNSPNAQLIGTALSNTGRADALQQVVCVGGAVPTPDWAAYLSDRSTIPSRCADGSTGTGFGSSAPEVTLFEDGYAAQRSVRSNVNWSGAVAGGRLVATVDATYSRNLQQPGMVNLNFDAVQRFSLAAEDDRPVFATAASIVPATGAIAPDQARRSPAFGKVLEQRSDLTSSSKQVSLSLQPVAFSSRYSWGLTYVYATTRDELFGFASTTRDPRAIDRGRSSMDSRHQIVYSLSYNLFDWVPVSWSGSFRSGRPFTPMVAGDVNGDGFANDRAFIFDAAALPEMGELLASGSRQARECLRAQLGRLAARNSCQGPWTSTSNLTIALNPVKFRLPQRMNVSLYVNNALGAADLLMHGERDRRGWGQAVLPEQNLLFVRGFDATSRRFGYEVNPRFGATDPNRVTNRNPVVVTAQIRLDVGFTRERQLLTQSLDRGRSRPGARSTDQDVRSMGVALLPPNPMAMLLAQADSLRLTRLQADSLVTINRAYSLRYEAIWTPVGKYLSALPPEYDERDAYVRYRKAREASIDALIGFVPSIRGLLTAQQLRRLAPQIATSLDARYLASVRSSTAGGANLGVMGMLAQMGWVGGTVDPNATAVFIHR